MGDKAERANNPSQARESIWTNEDEAKLLRRRALNFWNADYLERVVAPLLDLPQSAQALDVGCGYGGLTLSLAKAAADSWVLGIDLEAQAIAEAARLAEELNVMNVGFREGDATALPFEADTFDLVCCQTLLTHVPEPMAVLQEMIRVLKPGGTLFTVEYHNLGMVSAYDELAPEPSLEEALERFRLARLYIEGKRRLGRGDDTLGVRVAFMLQDLGLKLLEVRKNDRAWHAFPPYHKENERLTLATMCDFAEPLGEGMKRWIAENIRAGGGSEADVARHFALTDDPELKARIRERIEAGTYRTLSSYTFYLTVARKPRGEA